MPDETEATGTTSEEAPAAVAETPEYDTEGLKQTLDSAGAEARLAAEMEANRRARGHIPALQTRLDKAEKALSRIDAIELGVKSASERLDKIISSLPEGLLDGKALADLAPQRNETVAHLEARLEELAAQLAAATTPQQTAEPEIDPETAQMRAQWDAATDSVKAYAQSKGIELDDNDPQWGRAYRANPDDPSVAALDLMRHIDGLVEQKARREERKDASQGVGDGSRTPRQGSVTLAQLKAMTREEVKALPREVVAAAMAG